MKIKWVFQSRKSHHLTTSRNLTSDGDANVKSISPGAAVCAGVACVASVRADISLKTGLRLAVAVRMSDRTAAIAICSSRKKRALCRNH